MSVDYLSLAKKEMGIEDPLLHRIVESIEKRDSKRVHELLSEHEIEPELKDAVLNSFNNLKEDSKILDNLFSDYMKAKMGTPDNFSQIIEQIKEGKDYQSLVANESEAVKKVFEELNYKREIVSTIHDLYNPTNSYPPKTLKHLGGEFEQIFKDIELKGAIESVLMAKFQPDIFENKVENKTENKIESPLQEAIQKTIDEEKVEQKVEQMSGFIQSITRLDP